MKEASEKVISLAEQSLMDELSTAAIYARLAKAYESKPIAAKLKEFARMEANHTRFWANFLRSRGLDPSKYKISRWRLALRSALYRLLGIGLTLRILELGEKDAIEKYSKILESPELTEEEKKELRRILEDELVHEQEFESEESKFKEFLAHVRDAVLGMNDGLVEILSVSAGLAGAYGNPVNVALGGTIVGVGGALSMAIGTYVSVKAQKEVRLGTLSRVKLASKYVANVYVSRIVSYMRKKGFSKEVAETIAEDAKKDNELLGRLVAEEEYGLREEALENPRAAGIYTGVFYIIGAFIPLLPYFLMLPIFTALPLSFILAALILAMTAFIIAVSADLNVRRKITEMIVAGLGSATLTYGIGKLASILLGIEVG